MMAADGPEQTQLDRRIRREQNADALRWIALARSLAATLDLLPQPLVLVTPGAGLEVWHANTAALDRLASSSILPMRDGRLLPTGDVNAAELARAAQRALDEGPRQRHRIVLVAPDARTLPVDLRALDFGASADLPVSQLVMLEIHEKAPAERGLGRLAGRFHMTRKEAECAIGLYALGSVDRFARCSGKSVHTVRTQLKAAMQKSGTNTQAALVGLVADLLNE